MKPAFFPVIMGGRRGSVTQVFSPASLFTSGVVGAWYAPDDFSTLFQDSAGTTAVTAVEQPVGLMLDKSQGATLGSEATSGSWLNTHTTTFDTFTSTGPTGFTATTTGAKAPRVAVLASLPAAGWYWIEFTATFTGGSFSTVGVSNTGSPYSAAVATTVLPATGVAFKTLIYTSAAREYLTITFTASGASTLSVTGVSVKSLAGNHASQATSASRPVLRARYNLLTYSEQFDNAAWTKVATTVTANATTAPDGTTTADLLVSNTALTNHAVYFLSSLAAGVTYTVSVYAKASGYSNLVISDWNEATRLATFNLSNGTVALSGTGATVTLSSPTITAANNGFYLCSVTISKSTAGQVSFYVNSASSYSGDNTSGIYIWGADLRTGSSAGTYQRIAAATDYDTAGFLPYLAGDGVDDQMSSNSINLTATDKLTAVFGSLSNSTANQGVFQFGSGGAGTINALYLIGAPSDMRSSVQGSTGTSQMKITGSGVSTASVYSQLYDIAGATAADESKIRVNGTLPTQTVQSAGPAGGGNFANTTLTIFQYAGSFFLSGRIYQMIICGKTLSASELASTEAFVNTKTGAY
jgi:hypothetical protein